MRSHKSELKDSYDVPGAHIFYSKIPHPDGYFDQAKERLSIKWFPKGQALYETEGGQFLVRGQEYLLINHDQDYSITRPPETEVESFLIFFNPVFAAETLRGLVTPADRLLDMPFDAADKPPEFLTRIYSLDDILLPRLLSLKSSLDAESQDNIRLEEQLHDILEGLLLVRRGAQRELERISAVRRATRLELYRRLYRARDYAAATFSQPITIDEMARVACLSHNHFFRSFKQLFRQTPHQYLTILRLARAKELLLKTDLPVTEICLEVGFESLGSFSTLFRHRFGLSPQAYRRAHRATR